MLILMKLSMSFQGIPLNPQDVPWLKNLIGILEEQAHIIQKQAERITKLEKVILEQKDQIAHLKKLPKRPKFRKGGGRPKDRSGKPNTSSKNTDPASRQITPIKETEEINIPPVHIPEGSRFKGYQTYTVQELEIIPKDIIYKIEVWESPDGNVVRGTLPDDVKGTHFGADLRALVHNLYALGMTQPGLHDLLIGLGITISEGQVHNILMSESRNYERQSEEILAAGLGQSPFIRTDDTGAKHKHKNGYCTHIGGDYFAYYKTTNSKSRANFFNILLQGKEEYYINEAFIWHLFQSGVEDDLLNHFEQRIGKQYRTKKGMNRLLNQLGIGKKLRSQCLEAGLVGYISETILRPDQVLLSDRAGQFAIFDHAACWVHMERPLRKLSTTSKKVELELKKVREAIWVVYDKLKEASLTQTGKEEVHHLYDSLLKMKSSSPGITTVLTAFADYREEMLKALDHPGLPLHNNDSERDIRTMVKRRNISGSTKSQEGKAFRDGLMSLKQTCFRLGISFFGYLRGHFKGEAIDLAEMVTARYRSLGVGPSG